MKTDPSPLNGVGSQSDVVGQTEEVVERHTGGGTRDDRGCQLPPTLGTGPPMHDTSSVTEPP